MVRFAGEDGINVVLGVVEILAVEINFGAGEADFRPDFRDAFEFEVGEGLEGGVIVFRDALGADAAEGGFVADGQLGVGGVFAGAGVDFVGLSDLAALEGDVAVGEFDGGFFGGGEGRAGFARPVDE